MNMLKSIFKSALPHIVAVTIFAIVAIIYCKPALEGKVLQQSDITQWKGMAQDAFSFKEKYGYTPYGAIVCLGACPLIKLQEWAASNIQLVGLINS